MMTWMAALAAPASPTSLTPHSVRTMVPSSPGARDYSTGPKMVHPNRRPTVAHTAIAAKAIQAT